MVGMYHSLIENLEELYLEAKTGDIRSELSDMTVFI